MKTPFTILGTLAIGLSLVTACQSPDKAQKNADQARQEADDNTTKTNRETEQARQQDEANAQQKQAQADQSLTDAKNDYQSKLTTLLTDVDKRMSDIRASNLTAKPAAKTKNNENLATFAGKREILSAELRQIPPATAGEWNTLKDQIDKDTRDVRLMLLPIVGTT